MPAEGDERPGRRADAARTGSELASAKPIATRRPGVARLSARATLSNEEHQIVGVPPDVPWRRRSAGPNFGVADSGPVFRPSTGRKSTVITSRIGNIAGSS